MSDILLLLDHTGGVRVEHSAVNYFFVPTSIILSLFEDRSPDV